MRSVVKFPNKGERTAAPIRSALRMGVVAGNDKSALAGPRIPINAQAEMRLAISEPIGKSQSEISPVRGQR